MGQCGISQMWGPKSDVEHATASTNRHVEHSSSQLPGDGTNLPVCKDEQVEGDSSQPVSGLYPDAPYEYGAISPMGSLLFTAGACPLDEDGNVVGLNDHRAQAVASIENLRRALEAFDVRFDQLVKTTVYVVGDREDLVRAWRVVADGLAPHRPPSTLLGVSTLGYPGQLVEIEAIAAVPSHEGN